MNRKLSRILYLIPEIAHMAITTTARADEPPPANPLVKVPISIELFRLANVSIPGLSLQSQGDEYFVTVTPQVRDRILALKQKALKEEVIVSSGTVSRLQEYYSFDYYEQDCGGYFAYSCKLHLSPDFAQYAKKMDKVRTEGHTYSVTPAFGLETAMVFGTRVFSPAIALTVRVERVYFGAQLAPFGFYHKEGGKEEAAYTGGRAILGYDFLLVARYLRVGTHLSWGGLSKALQTTNAEGAQDTKKVNSTTVGGGLKIVLFEDLSIQSDLSLIPSEIGKGFNPTSLNVVVGYQVDW